MYKFKREDGVTIVVLVVTIIVLFILAAVGINLGTNNLSKTQDYKLKSELNMVQHAVLEQYTKFKTTKDESFLVGEKLSNDEVRNIANQMGVNLVNIPSTYSNADYYKLNSNSLTSIGIQDSEDEYIINYVSGEVINITHKKLENGEAAYIRANSFLNS